MNDATKVSMVSTLLFVLIIISTVWVLISIVLENERVEDENLQQRITITALREIIANNGR